MLMEESKEELKSLLLKVKEDSGNTVLKLNIQSSLMAQLAKNPPAMHEPKVKTLG